MSGDPEKAPMSFGVRAGLCKAEKQKRADDSKAMRWAVRPG